MNQVTIVMYHYVRELRRSRFPEIKGLELALFREQLAWLRRHYEIITVASLVQALRAHRAGEGWPLPPRAALLTFDDGYAEHYHHVFPLLDEAGLQGSFFPPAQVVLENQLLDVNRIHFVLAAAPDKAALVQAIFRELDAVRGEFDLEANEALYSRLAVASRYDPPEVIFIKRALQVALPAPLRARLAGALFAQFVSRDEAAFAAELYLSLDQVRCLVRHGMYVGSHGHAHPWLSSLDRAAQEREIDQALHFLDLIGTPRRDWVMCYPYGDYNALTLEIVRARGCALGLTTRVALASEADDPLTLPRLDTNDLPKAASAPPHTWTLRARSGGPG